MDGGPDPLVGAAAADVRHGGVDVGVAGATSTDWRLPLTVRTIGGMTHSGRGCQKTGVGAGQGEGALLRLVEPRRLFHRGTRTGLAFVRIGERAARDVGEVDVVVL